MTRCERKKFTAASTNSGDRFRSERRWHRTFRSVNFRQMLKRRFAPTSIPNFSIDAVEALAEFFR